MSEEQDFWEKIENTYPLYPTVRHRKRIAVNLLKKFVPIGGDSFVFDFGFGTGDVLESVKINFGLEDRQLGGCDISSKALEMIEKKIKSPFIYQDEFPKLEQKCDAVLCTEVIEHVDNYKEIIVWIRESLKDEGILILTTQSGKMHAIDYYSGHLRTFEKEKLCSLLENLGFEIKYSRLWGFPFFSMQKYFTNFNFIKIQRDYLEGDLTPVKEMFLNLVYLFYFIHDFIGCGPQLNIVAKKKAN